MRHNLIDATKDAKCENMTMWLKDERKSSTSERKESESEYFAFPFSENGENIA